LEGRSPAEIERDLLGRADKGEFGESGRQWVPALRTIQRDVKFIRPPDPSGGWAFQPTEGEDAAFLLATLATVITQTGGRVSRLTNGVAAWLQAIHAAAPDLDPWTAFTLAHMYQARSDRNLDWDDLDAWLAFGPWRGGEAAERYEKAVREGWIPPSPVAMNYASRVVIAAGLFNLPEARAKRGERRSKIFSVDGQPIDPEIHEELTAIASRARPGGPSEEVPADENGPA
jgi:hypothetical protein